ncbi:MAG: DUF5667 domain-containing protein [bacterium]|nr:DUF5667 domain-containing protein [bacterium]
MPVAIIIALLIAGGAGIAAETALPTDTLYPVKININEKLSTALTLGAKARAEHEIELAENRLEEAEGLAAKGELTSETRAVIEENFKEHALRVQERIEKFAERGETGTAAQLASKFETSLLAHATILSNLNTQLEGNTEASGNEELTLGKSAQAAANVAIQARISAEGQMRATSTPNVKAAAEGKLRAARNTIDEVKNFIARNRNRFTVTSSAAAEVEIARAEAELKRGETRLTAGAYGEAFAALQESTRIATRAHVLLHVVSSQGLSIDLSRILPSANVGAAVIGNGSVQGEVQGNNPQNGMVIPNDTIQGSGSGSGNVNGQTGSSAGGANAEAGADTNVEVKPVTPKINVQVGY